MAAEIFAGMKFKNGKCSKTMPSVLCWVSWRIQYGKIPTKARYVHRRIGRNVSNLSNTTKIPFSLIMPRTRNINLPLASAWNGESDEPNEISNWKDKDVTIIAGVSSQYQHDIEIGVIEKCIELVFAKETP
jgi:hypothetical protein